MKHNVTTEDQTVCGEEFIKFDSKDYKKCLDCKLFIEFYYKVFNVLDRTLIDKLKKQLPLMMKEHFILS